ncbi:MAG: ABC transporter substrate-binding protein [Oscillochloridaceae bacterium umkhey_bin13]
MNLAIRHLALLVALTISLAACGAAPTVVPTTPAPTVPAPTAVPTSVAAPGPISVTDDLGRTVALDSVPQRIVSLAPSVTEMLFAVGAGPQVVGTTSFCDFPPEATDLPEIGGFSASSISIEAIVGLEPDLVIAGTARQQLIAEQLEQLGIPVVVLAPASFDAVYASILQVGTLTGHSNQATQLVAAMQARVKTVTDVVATLPAEARPSVYWEVTNDPLMAAGPNTFIDQMIELVGATNIFADASEAYPQVNPETVFERDPQVILGPDSHGGALNIATVTERPGWANIQAVRDGRVYTLDGDIVSRPGPRLADALELLAATLYPAAFE